VAYDFNLGNKMNFDEWKLRDIHKGNFFITDGIIDIERWSKSDFKVLFLLKEAYSDTPQSDGEWDLVEYLSQGSSNLKSKMWSTVSQWCFGLKKLIETNEVVCFDDNHKNNPEYNEAFLSCAVINIKKSSGYKSSDKDDLSKYVISDWDLLAQQIDEISPDIIICGSTWPIIKSQINHEKCGEWLYKTNEYHFVDFWHPANHYPNKLNYYSLLTVLKLNIDKWYGKV